MQYFEPLAPAVAPNWGRVPPIVAEGAPRLDGRSLLVGSSAGELCITLHEWGVRLRAGPAVRDYGILLQEPEALALRLQAGTDAVSIEATPTQPWL